MSKFSQLIYNMKCEESYNATNLEIFKKTDIIEIFPQFMFQIIEIAYIRIRQYLCENNRWLWEICKTVFIAKSLKSWVEHFVSIWCYIKIINATICDYSKLDFSC